MLLIFSCLKKEVEENLMRLLDKDRSNQNSFERVRHSVTECYEVNIIGHHEEIDVYFQLSVESNQAVTLVLVSMV